MNISRVCVNLQNLTHHLPCGAGASVLGYRSIPGIHATSSIDVSSRVRRDSAASFSARRRLWTTTARSQSQKAHFYNVDRKRPPPQADE
uniref:Uncharacterized protein n=1 Tax=Anopheles quadriannulatus TaxID=34691 RepID=A0A182XTK0_ANOQN